MAEKHQVIPVNRAGASLIVAIADPSNIFAIDEVKFITGYNIEVVVAAEISIQDAIEKTTKNQQKATEILPKTLLTPPPTSCPPLPGR